MPCVNIWKGWHLTVADNYKPGDLPPTGYLDWYEWAEVQRKAGIKQVKCGRCGRWKTPQELSGIVDRSRAIRVGGKRGVARITIEFPVCTICATKAEGTKA